MTAGFVALCSCASHAPMTTPTPSRAMSQVDLVALVQNLSRETSTIRGLAFTREVPVTVQTPAQIASHLRDELARDRDEIEIERKFGVAMGIFPPGIDLVDVLSRFVGAEAQGYYDPETARLVLTEHNATMLGAPGPEGLDARATVVHELVHALQHQHFASRVETADDDSHAPALSDGARARLALLEGDATLVAMEWAQRRRGGRLLGAADMQSRVERWTDNAQVLTEADVPAYVVESTEMPYEAGVRGVAAMFRAGGFARVDAAIRNDRASAADVMHPERTEATSAVVVDPEDAALDSQGFVRTVTRTLGEMELRLQLGRVMRGERAALLASAWRGDRVALFERGNVLAVRWVVLCDEVADARAIADALRPLWDRWQREGCPGVAGSEVTRCPSRVELDGARVVIARGG